MSENHDTLRLIAQGVINSLFAHGRIRTAPVVQKLVDQGSYRFSVYLDDNKLPVIRVTVNPEELFAEALRKALVRRVELRK
jgi:hypothetical protein